MRPRRGRGAATAKPGVGRGLRARVSNARTAPARFAGLAAVLAAAAVPAGAQTTPDPAPVPSLPTRGQVEQPAPPVPRPDRGPRVTRRDAADTAPCPLASSTLRVTVTGVVFRAAGRDALPPGVAQALADVTAPTGEQPVSVVCGVRDRANAALARAGYVASVQVPAQKLTGGPLTLSVVLARITEVRVRGEAGHWRPVLARVIERLRALDPLNERDAERLLLLAGDVPGLEVQLALRPAGTGAGEVIGELAVATERVSLVGNVQNYGSKALGRETGYLRVDLAGVFAADDSLYLGGSVTGNLREQQVLQLGYRTGRPLDGLTFGPRVTVARSRPDVGELDLRSRSIIAGFDVTQALVRSVRRNLSVSVGVEAAEQRSRVFADGIGSPLNLDRIRAGYFRVDGRLSERRGDGLDAHALSLTAELRRGIRGLGATRRGRTTGNFSPSRFEGDPGAFIARGTLTGLGRITRSLSVFHSVLGQWANHPLLNFDEQAVGSLTVGLGYDPGANSADRFVGTHSEVRADLALIPKVPVQFFAFADNAWLWNLDSFSIENKRHLKSAGGGARARLFGPVLLEATYAKPLDRALSIAERRPPARFLLSLTAQLSPRLP